jgi:glycosyltransferase involved in cell wall biosynthesis
MEPAFEAGRVRTVRDRLAATVRLSSLLATRVVAVSGAVRDELLAMGISSSKVVVLDTPVDRRGRTTLSRDESRAALGYQPSDIVISTLGRAEPVKGWDILIQAFTEVARQSADARLLLVGSTDREEERRFFRELHELIHRHELGQRVRFTGYLEDVTVPLSATDLFILPSRSEGNSAALLEALAAGLPCVCTRVGTAAEAVLDGVNGILVERGNHRELGDAMKLLVRDPALRARFAAAAKPPLTAPSFEQEAEQWYQLYAPVECRGGTGP